MFNTEKINPVFVIVAVVLITIIYSSLFIVRQTEQALVLQFGKPVNQIKTPGLKFKLPFVQNVIFFDNRILDMNADPREVIAADQKRLIVDAFAKYQIVDSLKFFQTVRDEFGIRNRLNTILDSSLRQVLGSVPLSKMLTTERTEIMKHITTILNTQGEQFGIKVLDVRIMRADLPQKNSEAIFKRMQTEREREAKEIRATGEEEAQGIRSRADKERVFIIADAKKKSETIRGLGDADVTRIFGDAYNKDPDFAGFYRSMLAYRQTINKEDTTLVLSPDSEFLKYFDR